MKKNRIEDYVKSLEKNELKEGQESLLLTSGEGAYGGGSHNRKKCINTGGCEDSINDKRCSNSGCTDMEDIKV